MFTATLGTVSIALLSLAILTPVPTAERAILDAIRQVECRGQDNCPDGDGGRSIGPYQISLKYYRDAVEFDPRIGGDYQDCRNRAFAERVVRAYMLRYAPEAWKSGDAEVIARTHNGGPRGASSPATIKYWERVKRALDAPPSEPRSARFRRTSAGRNPLVS
jgi:destabilase